MALADELSLDLAAGIADHEQTFEWGGEDFACVRNPSPADLTDEDGGLIEGIDYSILVATAVFLYGLPQIGDGIDGGAAQIKRIDTNVANLILYAGSFDR